MLMVFPSGRVSPAQAEVVRRGGMTARPQCNMSRPDPWCSDMRPKLALAAEGSYNGHLHFGRAGPANRRRASRTGRIPLRWIHREARRSMSHITLRHWLTFYLAVRVAGFVGFTATQALKNED